MTTRRRLPASERREQLLGVAREVFAQRGYEAGTVEEIADRAGVTKPVVYQHFAGKDRLYHHVVDREVRALTQRLADCLAEGGHPREITERTADAFLAFIEERPDGFRVLVRDAPAGPEKGAIASVTGEVANQAERVFADQLHERGFDRRHAPLYGRMLVGAVALVGEWWLEVRQPDRAEVAAHVVNMLWNGLKDLDRDPMREYVS